MAVMLTRCDQTIDVVHRKDQAWGDNAPENKWTLATDAPDGADVFTVHAINSDRLSAAFSSGIVGAHTKVCRAGWSAMNGDPVPDIDILPHWITSDLGDLIADLSNGEDPLSRGASTSMTGSADDKSPDPSGK
jgi:hypothetical protein